MEYSHTDTARKWCRGTTVGSQCLFCTQQWWAPYTRENLGCNQSQSTDPLHTRTVEYFSDLTSSFMPAYRAQHWEFEHIRIHATNIWKQTKDIYSTCYQYMEVSENGDTPKSSIYRWMFHDFPVYTIQLLGIPFSSWGPNVTSLI